VADVVTAKIRSRIMSRITGRNTTPERAVRSFLHRQGFRFRLHRRNLPGRPDIVLPRYKVAIFVNGCFWHQHKGCPDGTFPASNRAFWRKKLGGNVARDRRSIAALRAEGWRIAVVWECALRRAPAHPTAMPKLVRWIKSQRRIGLFP
jgi:DNA mismatch endonuclease, patch repair protein